MTTSYEALINLIRSRRSVRRFRADPIEQETIGKLIEAARWAPSASNRQAYRFLAVSDQLLLNRMAAEVSKTSRELLETTRNDMARDMEVYLANFVHFRTAPLVLAPIRRAGFDLLAASAQRETSRRSAQAMLDAHASVSAATMNLLLAAESLGLGACWMTGPLLAAPALHSILHVPQGWELSAIVPIGYPDESPETPPRKRANQLWKRVDGADEGETT